MNSRLRIKKEENIVSKELSVYVKDYSLMIDGLDGVDLSQYEYVSVNLGQINGIFVVLSKDLISNKVKLKEVGYWASKIGKDEEKVQKCSFDNITYESISDIDEIENIRKKSAWC